MARISEEGPVRLGTQTPPQQQQQQQQAPAEVAGDMEPSVIFAGNPQVVQACPVLDTRGRINSLDSVGSIGSPCQDASYVSRGLVRDVSAHREALGHTRVAVKPVSDEFAQWWQQVGSRKSPVSSHRGLEESSGAAETVCVATAEGAKPKSCQAPAVSTANGNASFDMSRVRKSLTKLRHTLTAPELDEHIYLGSHASMNVSPEVLRQEEHKIPDAHASKSISPEVLRLAQRMERAFLMFPTEAVQSRQQDDGTSTPMRVEEHSAQREQEAQSTKLCAQFAEVLELGRQACKREVAELECRIARVESFCSYSAEGLKLDFEEQIAAYGREETSRWTHALECERVARQKEVAELCQALIHDRVLSSTGGTTHHPASDLQPIFVSDTSLEVDAAVEVAFATSKEALSQHVMEIHQQLSEDLMEKLRESVSTTSAALESRLQEVNKLFSHCAQTHRISHGNRSSGSSCTHFPDEGPLEVLDECSRGKVIAEGSRWPQSTTDLAPREMSIPMEREIASPRGAHGDSKEHACDADIADEGLSALPPHVRKVQGASREVLSKQQARLVALGEPLQVFGPGSMREH